MNGTSVGGTALHNELQSVSSPQLPVLETVQNMNAPSLIVPSQAASAFGAGSQGTLRPDLETELKCQWDALCRCWWRLHIEAAQHGEEELRTMFAHIIWIASHLVVLGDKCLLARGSIIDSATRVLTYRTKAAIQEVPPLDVGNFHCAICLEDYQDGEALRMLPCFHCYHRQCIDSWLLPVPGGLPQPSSRVCPVCRAPVVLTSVVLTSVLSHQA